MLQLLIGEIDNSIISKKKVKSVTIFIENSSGHPKPLIKVDSTGKIQTPTKASEQSVLSIETDSEALRTALHNEGL